MAKNKRKVVVTTAPKKEKLRPTTSKKSTSKRSIQPMLFTKENYKLVLVGVGLITLGFLFMAGGSMPSPDVWDESLIYSHRRITIAPILILSGLVVEIYAIFK